jgi:hypothetical protein
MSLWSSLPPAPHDEPAAHELIALALALDPGEEVVDVGEHRLWRGGFGHGHEDSASGQARHRLPRSSSQDIIDPCPNQAPAIARIR